MDLSHVLDAHADAATLDSAPRLASGASKAHLRARVRRGRRHHTVGVATGVAAGAAILMATGAWAAPRVLGEPAQIAPIATPSATPSPAPSLETYVAAPLVDEPGPGDEDYLTPMLGAYRSSGPVQCEDLSTVPISQQGSPFPGYVSGLPTWLMPQSLTGDPIPLYYADMPQYGIYQKSVSELYPADHDNTVVLINPEGGWWTFTAYYEVEKKSSLHAAGVYLKLFLDDCAGGNRTYGGPVPPGIYQARELTAPANGVGDSVVRDLGQVEMRPWNTIDVTATS